MDHDGAERSSPGSHRSRIVRRVVVGLVVGVLALIAGGLVFEFAAAATSARRFPPPGELHVVDGTTLHLHCVGEGRPTVVLESGAGSGSLVWAWVQPMVARETRACSYDRAGYGWSDAARHEFDPDRVVEDLRGLLSEAGEVGPFVLVGHSLGGHYGRMFVHAYPDDVVGMVLVDARHPALPDRMDGYDAWIDEGRQTLEIGLMLARFGVMRLLGDVFGTMATLPDGVPEAMVATTLDARNMRAQLAEVQYLRELDARAAAVADLGQRPLVVLSAGRVADDAIDAGVWGALQRDLVTLAADAESVVVPDADHLSILTEESHARNVSDAIRAVVRSVRDGRDGRGAAPD